MIRVSFLESRMASFFPDGTQYVQFLRPKPYGQKNITYGFPGSEWLSQLGRGHPGLACEAAALVLRSRPATDLNDPSPSSPPPNVEASLRISPVARTIQLN